MSHAALVFWCVAGLTLLLVMFLFAVIAMPPEDAVPTEPPALKTPPPPPSPVRRPPATVLPAGSVGQLGGAGYAPRHGDALEPEQKVVHRPEVSGGPPWEPAPKPPGLDLSAQIRLPALVQEPGDGVGSCWGWYHTDRQPGAWQAIL